MKTTMKFSAIDKMGVELEGGWDAQQISSSASNRTVQTDGSVRFTNACNPHEIVPVRPFTTLEDGLRWVEQNYPDHTNHTCGMHTHFSLHRTYHYRLLMLPEFHVYFMKGMEDWGKRLNISNENFWKRLRGENSHCQRAWNPDVQIRQSGKDSSRYAHWNFCYRIRKTAECRMLPTFKDRKIACAAITELAQIVESWIARSPVGIEFSSDEDYGTEGIE
jgi:hypothetical protein